MDAVERAKRFRQARNEKNANGKQTVRMVEECTKIPKSTISKMESDKDDTNIGYKDIVTLANHYGVNVAWLMGQSDSPVLDVDSQTVTKATGLSAESVSMLQTMENDGLIDSMNALLQSEDFIRFVRWFKTARIINKHCTDNDNTTSVDDEAYQGMIEDTNGQAVDYAYFPGESQIDMCLLRATNIINTIFWEIMKGEKDNG